MKTNSSEMRLAALFMPLLATLPHHPLAAKNQVQGMNVLFIIADDMRPALGCYGYPQVLTPNIDRVAARGTVFRQAYCNAPISGASRASLLTGLYPSMPERFSRFDAWASKDAPDAVTIPLWFKNNGYTTLSVGKVFHNLKDHDTDWSEYPWRLNPDGYGRDWADYNKWELWLNDDSSTYVNEKTGRGPFCEAANRPDEDYDDGQVAQKAIDNLKKLAQSQAPFFMAVGFWRPHLPFNCPQKYWDLYDEDEILIAENRFLPENMPRQCTGSTEIRGYGLVGDTSDPAFHAKARHAYYACVSFIDAQIGKIISELERTGLSENTVVVIIGDHGWHLGEHNFWGKHNLLFNAIAAPLIIAAPDGRGRVTEAVAQFVDIFPTMCDYAGLNIPSGLSGKSLRPVVDGRKKSVNDYAFIQWESGMSVADGRFVYTSWYGKDGERKAQMLYDHKRDPDENHNVVLNPAYGRHSSRLAEILDAFRLWLKSDN